MKKISHIFCISLLITRLLIPKSSLAQDVNYAGEFLHDRSDKLPQNIALFYYKVNKVDYESEYEMDRFLQYYDPNYNNYGSNEFDLKSKINDIKKKMPSMLDNVRFDQIFYSYRESAWGESTFRLGEYNFDTHSFPFDPLDEKLMQLMEGELCRVKEYKNFAIVVSNKYDFKDIYMDEAAAKKMLTKLEGHGRNLYIKMYFSVMKERAKESETDLSCYVYRIDVYAEKCAKGLVYSFIAKTDPPDYLVATRQNFEAAYKNGNLNDFSSITKKIEISSGEKLFNSIDKIEKNCESSFFRAKYKINKVNDDLFQISYTFYYNSNVSFFPGFYYTIFDLAGNEYPLMVSSISGSTQFKNIGYDNVWYASGVNINITKTTLQRIVDNGIKAVRFQVNQTSSRPATGAGIAAKEGTVNVGNGEWWQWELDNIDRNNFKSSVLQGIK